MVRHKPHCPPRDKVFVSYSHRDQEWLERLRTMLAPLIRSGSISLWDDTKIQAGAKWKKQIEAALASAWVAVLLVSDHFLASNYIAQEELPPLLAAAEKEGVTILWVYVSACLYDETPIKDYQAAHDTAHTLDEMSEAERKRVLVKICRRIKEAAQGANGRLDMNTTGERKHDEVPTLGSPEPLPSPPSTSPQAAFEAEVRRLERLLNPLPESHLKLLKKFVNGPQVIRSTEERNSLSNLHLIRYIGRVNSKEALWESSSEAVLRECLGRRRQAELPRLIGALSSEEKAFLRLFLLSDPAGPGGFNRENLLPHHVYRTHWSLCEKELLQSLPATEPATEVYALVDDAVCLVEAELGSQVAQTELLVDLHAVRAVNSSGSGAR